MKYEDKLLDHNYDGIQELDNSLPPWWLNLFYITLVWGFLYVIYYHVTDMGFTQEEEYKAEMGMKVDKEPLFGGMEYKTPYAEEGKAPQPAQNNTAAAATEEPEVAESVEPATDYKLVTDAARLKSGADVYVKNCVSCHGAAGEGGIGPNLTDAYWINGDGGMNGLVKVINDGVPIKGMIAWKPLLSEEQIVDVASHIYNMKGTNPANGKEPQGEKYGE